MRLAFLTVLLLAYSAWADATDAGVKLFAGEPAPTLELTSTPPEFAADGPGLGTLLLQTGVGLGLVVALIYLTLNIGLRRLLGIKPLAGGASRVSVIERIPLDQKRVLFVVRAGAEVLLVGGGEENLNLITKLNAAEFPTPPVAQEGGVQMSPLLKKLLGRREPEAPKAPPT